MSRYDFDTPVSRLGTGSLKWDKYADRDVLPFWVADMDFKSAPEIIEALHSRVDHGVFGYTKPYASVVGSTLDYLSERHAVKVGAEDLEWLPGLVPALNVAARAFGSEGASILSCTPVYPPFLTAPGNQHKQLVTAPLVWRDGTWAFDFEAMEAALTPETSMFILCNPHNPVGRSFSRAELLELADFCMKHDLVLCSDEIHCDLILDSDIEHVAMGSLDHPIRERLVSLFSPSKTYNLPGLACSYAVIEDVRLRRQFQRAALGTITEVNAFGYAGCEAAYRFGEAWRLELLKVLRANRDALYTAVEPFFEKVVMRPMQATYLAWLDMRGVDAANVAAHFEAHGIGLSDGAPFGNPGHLRFNFGCPPVSMSEGLKRLVQGLEAVF